MFETLMTVLFTALTNAQADWRNADSGYRESYEWDDQSYYYKCRLRAEYRLRDLGVRNFDVA